MKEGSVTQKYNLKVVVASDKVIFSLSLVGRTEGCVKTLRLR